MEVLEILFCALVGGWVGLGLCALYEYGYDAGERAGRRQCRCIREGRICPLTREVQQASQEGRGDQQGDK